MTARLQLPADLAAKVAEGTQLVVPMDGDWKQTHPDVREVRMVAPEPGVYEVWSQDHDEPCTRFGQGIATVTVDRVVGADDVLWRSPFTDAGWKWACVLGQWIIYPDQRHPAIDAAPYLGLIETTDD